MKKKWFVRLRDELTVKKIYYRKPTATVSGRFLDFFITKINFFQKCLLMKKPGNLPRPVSGGFQRFPDDPSLTDHTVVDNRHMCVSYPTDLNMTQVITSWPIIQFLYLSVSALDFCNSPVWNIEFYKLDFYACCSL